MKRCRLFLFVTTLCLSLVQLALAQTSGETASALPRLVRFGGTVRDLNGSPLTGVAGITSGLNARPLEQRRTSGGKQDYDRADSRVMHARAIAVVLRRRKAELAPVVVA